MNESIKEAANELAQFDLRSLGSAKVRKMWQYDNDIWDLEKSLPAEKLRKIRVNSNLLAQIEFPDLFNGGKDHKLQGFISELFYKYILSKFRKESA